MMKINFPKSYLVYPQQCLQFKCCSHNNQWQNKVYLQYSRGGLGWLQNHVVTLNCQPGEPGFESCVFLLNFDKFVPSMLLQFTQLYEYLS